MTELSRKHMMWIAGCRDLAIDEWAFSDEGAVMYVGVLAVDTLLELGEDLEETAATIELGVKEVLSGEVSRLGISRIHLAARTDGKELGLNISVDPTEFSDEDFQELVTALVAGLREYLW